MLITVEIKHCMQCRHRDHSGSFTAGGARQICGHGAACKARRTKAQFKKEYPMYAKDISTDWRFHWYNRIVDKHIKKRTIPTWCPLAHGEGY